MTATDVYTAVARAAHEQLKRISAATSGNLDPYYLEDFNLVLARVESAQAAARDGRKRLGWLPKFDLGAAPAFCLRGGVVGFVAPGVDKHEANAIINDMGQALMFSVWATIERLADVLVLIVPAGPEGDMGKANGRTVVDNASGQRWVLVRADIAGTMGCVNVFRHELLHALYPNASEQQVKEFTADWQTHLGRP